MKRYKMNEMRVGVNQSNSGVRWTYRGKYNSVDDAVAEAKRWSGVSGVRVTDAETNEIVYEELW